MPISVLNVFSNTLESYVLNQIIPFFDKIQPKFISAYRSRYSSQHVLLRLIEERRKCLDENKVVGAILMDLSKYLNCRYHDCQTRSIWVGQRCTKAVAVLLKVDREYFM